ncbi:MAG: tetratricopeptide repeat protein [Deltaproteobacteria bacterium]
MAKKVIRKKIPVGVDEFVTSRSMIFKYLSDNFRAVVVATSVIGVLFISYIGWGTYSRQRDQKAADALSAAMKVYQAKIEPAGTTPDTFKSADDKYRAVINKFEDISKKYKRLDIGSIALLYAADAHYNLKEYDKSIELYSKLLTGEVKDTNLHGNINAYKLNPGILRDSAIYGIAHSYEQKGEIKKGIDSLLFLTSTKDTHLKEMGLSALGRLYEKSNDKAKALETYQKVISDFPESSNLSRIKEKVEGLKS